MKQQHITTFIINIAILLFFSASIQAQSTSKVKTNKDTLNIQQKYGLRVGVDTGKIIRTFAEDDYKGFEISADFRYSNRLYIAGEVGTEDKTNINDYLDVTTTGSYFKAGIDYNLYQNWLDMDNMVYTGFRLGASSFNHTLNEFEVYSTNQYWAPQYTSNTSQEFNGLTALWLELIIGIKAEIFKNLYLGLNLQMKTLVTEKIPENFENIYIPGFNRTYDSSGIGTGVGYSISYRIPIYKKIKRIAPVK
ncbi:DUF6048 family protein [Mariniflexile ostreae]|uniref:DUF6048 family protein n=1 Tax=Mariniflexile ostreae TaxID=1520892 RepID=A0ABV5FDL5_9FLAO